MIPMFTSLPPSEEMNERLFDLFEGLAPTEKSAENPTRNQTEDLLSALMRHSAQQINQQAL